MNQPHLPALAEFVLPNPQHTPPCPSQCPNHKLINSGIRIAAIQTDMARRKRNDDWWVGPIIQLGALVVLACIFIPGIRQTLFSIGTIALLFLGIVALCLVVFGIYRLATSERSLQPLAANVFEPSSPVPYLVPAGDGREQRQPSQPLYTTELIEQLRSMDWFQFEKLVGHVYRKLGYSVTHRGGANPDGGIDLIIEKDGRSAAVQCKQWKTRDIGVKAVREFLGALTDAGIREGIFITLRGYTGEAKQLAEKHEIKIVNEVGLAQMLESTDARFDLDVLELLHDKCKFCPKCEREMVIRVARKGSKPGSRFWACTNSRRCGFTMSIA